MTHARYLSQLNSLPLSFTQATTRRQLPKTTLTNSPKKEWGKGNVYTEYPLFPSRKGQQTPKLRNCLNLNSHYSLLGRIRELQPSHLSKRRRSYKKLMWALRFFNELSGTNFKKLQSEAWGKNKLRHYLTQRSTNFHFQRLQGKGQRQLSATFFILIPQCQKKNEGRLLGELWRWESWFWNDREKCHPSWLPHFSPLSQWLETQA